jgi:hypothetical protein
MLISTLIKIDFGFWTMDSSDCAATNVNAAFVDKTVGDRSKCLMAASATFMAESVLLMSPSTRTRSDEGFKSFDLLMLREFAR